VLIGVHGIVAVTNKSVAAGTMVIARNHARILFVVILFVFLLILITTLPGEVFLT
jgi:hypothetical protein